MFLDFPHFAPSIYKSSKHFGLRFAYDAPKIWNNLPGDVHLATSLYSFRKKLKTSLHKISLHKHVHPNFSFSKFLFVVLTIAMSRVNDYSFLYGAPRICL